MKTVGLLVLPVLLLSLTACQPANVLSAKWDSGINAANAQTRCMRVDMRDQKEMDEKYPRFDGWKLVYLSEYTTGNRFGTDGVACFEKSMK